MSIQVENVYKSYRQGEREIKILRGLNLSMQSGETVAILGKSGSGKSTLLSLLASLDKADSGSIKVGGADLSAASRDQAVEFRARKLGIVFQQFHLMSKLKAWENVALSYELNGGGLEARARSLQILAELGLEHRAEHFPHQLSGGECQRVAIARALVRNPEILLADEPSGNLDQETGQQVMQKFFSLVKAKSLTCILVTHSQEMADFCARKYWLRDGVLHAAATGTA